MKRTLILFALAALLVTGIAMAGNSTPTVDWWVIGGGGGHQESGICSLDGTIGQPLVGTVSNTPYDLCTGFWCGTFAEHRIYLPIVLRN